MLLAKTHCLSFSLVCLTFLSVPYGMESRRFVEEDIKNGVVPDPALKIVMTTSRPETPEEQSKRIFATLKRLYQPLRSDFREEDFQPGLTCKRALPSYTSSGRDAKKMRHGYTRTMPPAPERGRNVPPTKRQRGESVRSRLRSEDEAEGSNAEEEEDVRRSPVQRKQPAAARVAHSSPVRPSTTFSALDRKEKNGEKDKEFGFGGKRIRQSSPEPVTASPKLPPASSSSTSPAFGFDAGKQSSPAKFPATFGGFATPLPKPSPSTEDKSAAQKSKDNESRYVMFSCQSLFLLLLLLRLCVGPPLHPQPSTLRILSSVRFVCISRLSRV